MSEPTAQLACDALAGIRYRLTFTAEVYGPSDMYPALVRFVFLDANGATLPVPPPGQEGAAAFLHSTLFGAYRYVGMPKQAGKIDVDMVFELPHGCTKMRLEVHLWRAEGLQMHDRMEVMPESFAEAEAEAEAERDTQLADRIMGVDSFAVRAGESYDLELTLEAASPLQPRDVLAAFRFFDAKGARLDPPPNLPSSELVGAFRYVVPADGTTAALASVTVPANATTMQVRVIRWKVGKEMNLRARRLVWLGTPEAISAEGEARIEPLCHYALRGSITACGGDGALMGAVQIMFSDEHGAPVLTQAEGLSRSDRFVNHIRLARPTPQWLDESGSFPLAHAFVAPPGASRVAWRLLGNTGGWQLDAESPLSLAPFSDAPLPQIDELLAAARFSNLAPEQAHALRAALPAAPMWQATALGTMQLLGQALCPAEEHHWIALQGQITGAAAQTFVCPLYFDADMVPLPNASCLGCATTEGLGPTRSLLLRPSGNDTAGFDESFRTPPGAAFAAFHLLSPADRSKPSKLSELRTTPRRIDAVCAEADIAELSIEQLRSLVQLAEAVGDLRLQARASRLLAVLDPREVSFARRAEELDEMLLVLEPRWLPAVAGPVLDTRDSRSVLHLMAALAPQNDSPDALRNAALLQAQIAQGLRPVVCLPIARKHVDTSDDLHRDGLEMSEQEGIVVARPRYLAFDPDQLPPAALLELETDAAELVLQRTDCGLIHACGDWDIGLKALALATLHSLPFVYEPRLHDDPADTSLAPLYVAQRNRCLAEADAIIAQNETWRSALQTKMVSDEKIFCVNHPTDPAGITAAYTYARAHHRAALQTEGR